MPTDLDASSISTGQHGQTGNCEVAKLVEGMTHTMCGLDTTLQRFNEQSSIFSTSIKPNMDRTAEIQDLETRLRDHRKTQTRLINAAKKTIREDFKKVVTDRLKNDISAQIRKEVTLQVKAQVDQQISLYIPIPLEQQVMDNNKQIKEIRISLANSEARSKNSHIQATNVDEPLALVLKPDGSRSKLFPADLRSLFSYDLDTAKALVRDFEIEADDISLQVNYGRFMRHIGLLSGVYVSARAKK